MVVKDNQVEEIGGGSLRYRDSSISKKPGIITIFVLERFPVSANSGFPLFYNIANCSLNA